MAGSSTRDLILRLVTETKGVGEGVDQVNSKMSKFGGALKVAGGAMAAAFSVEKVVDWGRQAIDEASSVSESISKIGQVFGDSAKEATNFAKQANKSLGLSDRQATEMVGTLGNMWNGFGKTKKESLNLSKGTLQLAADLGSFNNLGTDEVIDMMSSAFRGEYDSIQRIMPGISGASVAQEALAQTGKKSADQLTESEKAMAAYTLMMKQAGPAAGDFARTSGGAANQAKIMQANMDDLKNSIGQQLLPVFQAVLSFINTGLIPGLMTAAHWIANEMIPWIAKAAQFIWQYIEPVFNAISTIVKGVWDVLFNFVMLVYDIFTGKWGDAWQRVLGIFKGFWEIIRGYIDLFWHYIQFAWNVILTTITTVGGLIWDAMKWPFVQFWQFIQVIWDGILRGIKNGWDGVTNFFRDTGTAIKNAITWPFEKAWDFIKGFWNRTFGSINFTVPKWIPGIGGEKFGFPKLAQGGIVTRPTLALVGERGPEAVVPLSKAGALGGGNVFNINVRTGVGDPYEIGKAVVAHIQAYERIAGPRATGARGGVA